MEIVLIAGLAAVGCVVGATILMSLVAILIVEVLPDHTRRLKAWLRAFGQRRRATGRSGLLAA